MYKNKPTMINVTLGAADTLKEKPFPKLMICSSSFAINNGMIVFFTKYKSGIVIANGVTHSTGDFQDNWLMNHFTDYNEPITIQNA